MGDPQRESQEKYIRKTNIWAPNQNEIEMSVQRYLAKESRTPELCTLFFYKGMGENTTIIKFI